MEKPFKLWTVEYSGPSDSIYDDDLIDLGNYEYDDIKIAITNGEQIIPILRFDGYSDGEEVNDEFIKDLGDDGDYVPGAVLKAEIERLRSKAFEIATAFNQQRFVL